MLGPRQPQFLLPLLPAFALMISYLLFSEELVDHGEQRFSMSLVLPMILLGVAVAAVPLLQDQDWIPQMLKTLPPLAGGGIVVFGLLIVGLPASGLTGRIVLITGGLLLTLIPSLPQYEALPAVLWELPRYVGIGIALLGVALTWVPSFTLDQRIIRNAIFSMVTVIGLMAYLNVDDNSRSDIDSSARFLASLEQQQIPIAHLGEYQGQFHFYGRLTQSITTLSPDMLDEWLVNNPQGVVITYANEWQPDPDFIRTAPAHAAPFANTELRIWQATTLIGSS
jgi:hypothetical protein